MPSLSPYCDLAMPDVEFYEDKEEQGHNPFTIVYNKKQRKVCVHYNDSECVDVWVYSENARSVKGYFRLNGKKTETVKGIALKYGYKLTAWYQGIIWS